MLLVQLLQAQKYVRSNQEVRSLVDQKQTLTKISGKQTDCVALIDLI